MKKEIAVGFLFLLLLATAFFQTIISNKSKLSDYPYRMKLFYSRIDGLREGTEVYVKGVPSGIVLSIDIVDTDEILDTRYLDKSRSKAIELTLAMREPITLWDNYKVRFNTKTIFSDRIIDIDPGFYPGDNTVYYKPTFPPGETNQSDFFPSARYIDNFFEAANGVIRENQTDIRTIVLDSKEISEKLLGTEGSLPKLINTMEAYDELDNTIALIGITMREGRRYQEGHRKMEQTHPIPFLISSSFLGGTTLGGREVGNIDTIRGIAPF